MDKRFCNSYERELRFLRELGCELARKIPRVAGRLGVSELACEDPHVERLFRGFAVLSA
jgi:type VI secretion system protein ImpG